jgi:hypothetical protein
MVELESLPISFDFVESGSGFFRSEALEWSNLEEIFGVMCTFFKEKVHSMSVAPETLAIWNKKLESLVFWKTWKASSEGMYSAAPEHLSRFFFIIKTRVEDLLSSCLVAFLSEVGESWQLALNWILACSRGE